MTFFSPVSLKSQSLAVVAMASLLMTGCSAAPGDPDAPLVEVGGVAFTQRNAIDYIGLGELMIGKRLSSDEREAVIAWQVAQFSTDPFGAQMTLHAAMERLREIDEAEPNVQGQLLDALYDEALIRELRLRLMAAGRSIPTDTTAFAELADRQLKGFWSDIEQRGAQGDLWSLIMSRKAPLNSQIETALQTILEDTRTLAEAHQPPG